MKSSEVDPLVYKQFFVEVAGSLPKIPVTDGRVVEYEKTGIVPEPSFFGNNFHLLFRGIWMGNDAPRYLSMYVDDAKRHEGFDHVVNDSEVQEVLAFLSLESTIRCEKLDAALIEQIAKQTQPNLFGDPIPGFIEEVNEAAGEPIGVARANLFMWDRLNPLLKEASKPLTKIGVITDDYMG